MGLYQRAVRWISHTWFFARVMSRIIPPVDRVIHRITGGRHTVAGASLPTFLLVHTGAKSGREYRTPVSYVTIADRFALAASNFGQQHHPAWSYNLLAHPDVSVVVAGETLPVRARRVSDEEKEALWPRFVEMWPAYDTYKKRAAHRNIKVFVLERR